MAVINECLQVRWKHFALESTAAGYTRLVFLTRTEKFARRRKRPVLVLGTPTAKKGYIRPQSATTTIQHSLAVGIPNGV